MTPAPAFAVVGHPNKGKSSVVSTLAQDDSVAVGPEPGTTLRCRHYPMRVDGELIYTLVDTPGFQRARRAWAWLRERETTAAEHRKLVAEFVAVHREGGGFDDECELLTPILDGAGILYVVDGSRPYGPEYEAEMEILRWTGQPSLALINCIQDDDCIDQWKAALRQYFQVVRVFDALEAPFAARLELLRAFGELEEDWREPLSRAVSVLEQARAWQHESAARAIAEMLGDVLSHSTTRRLRAGDDPQRHYESLERELRDQLRERERRGREAVESIYAHHVLQRAERDVELLDTDLFSTDDWYLWGLSRRQLLTAGAAGGAVVGGAVDVAVGGASLLLGSAIGALVGGATALFGSQRLANVRVLALPLGGVELQCGPVRHENFPWVLLGRALHHRDVVSGRSHANRSPLDLADSEPVHALDGLGAAEREALDASFRRLREGVAAHEVVDALASAIGALSTA